MSKIQRLELTWIGKDDRPRLEPRILLEDPALSHHAKVRHEGDIFDNRLIFGDNLLALKALETEFSGKVKCVFIDPPYNTGTAFEHYDDGIEHSLWLSLIRDRIDVIKNLLSSDGSLWITIDQNESHYLKVLLDEVFGRSNFWGEIVWQHSVQGKNDAKTMSLHHNYLLVYSNSEDFIRNKLPRQHEHNVNYSNPDRDPKGPWRSGDVRSPNYRENLRYNIVTPNGKTIFPPANGWRWSEQTLKEKTRTGEIQFTQNDTKVLRKIYLCDQDGRVPESIWFATDAGTTREATNELRQTCDDSQTPFATPKPEKLLQRVLQIATNPGDLVLDSFAGSGTTGAVAHKMGRRWIMVELGEHCHTHIIPRLKKVIDGKDQGSITEAVGWQGGGGFRYFRLAPSLLVKDRFDNWVIAPSYNPAMLAEAICKLMGFTYAPSQEAAEYWRHGYSTETDFIYVTTQSLTYDALKKLSEEVGRKRTLLVCCKAWSGNDQALANLTIKKIPQAVLKKCEWSRDDYSLKVADLPAALAAEAVALADSATVDDTATPKRRGRSRKAADAGPSLFAAIGAARDE
jgi:adenine-specific DNA-methyltransferase